MSQEVTAALSAVVDAYGGRLEHVRPCEVQYRPHRHVVVRYDARVAWHDSLETRRETLLAATTQDGVLDGTVPIEATTDSGAPITVGVWRWPYDPKLPGLTHAVTPRLVAPLVRGLVDGPLTVTVRAYRPTERAVVQVSGAGTRSVFVKVLPSDSIVAIADRHRQLHAAGLPVPLVLGEDDDLGLLVLAALPGRTLRQQLAGRVDARPTPAAFRAVFDGFARTQLAATPPVRSRASMALGHARMLRTVAPEVAEQLAEFDAPFTRLSGRSTARTGPVIHGDLYDAQLLSTESRITGVLDVDDAGPGDPLDDRATVLGFLLVKALYAHPRPQAALIDYVQTLRSGFAADADVDAVDLDHATAAVLVGLATGPFRGQRAGWRADVVRHLALARHVMACDGAAVARLDLQERETPHATS